MILVFDQTNGTSTLHGFSDIIWQVVAGHVYNKTLWFQSLLIILTALFALIMWIGRSKRGPIICTFLGVCCLFLQYTGSTLQLKQIEWPNTIGGGYFDKSYVINTIGRLFEMIPYASLGMIMRKQFHSHINNKTKYLLLIGTGITIIFQLSFKVFDSIDGFYYQGLEKIVC